MKRIANRRVLWVAALALAVGVGIGLYARAAPNVPGGIAYSGFLRDGNGMPVNGMHNFVFDLYDGMAKDCTDIRNNAMVANGRIDVPDLFGGNCLLDSLLATKANLSVAITVDGSALMPFQPLGTVPFAARARVAESVDLVTTAATVNVPDATFSNQGPFTGQNCLPGAKITATVGNNPVQISFLGYTHNSMPNGATFLSVAQDGVELSRDGNGMTATVTTNGQNSSFSFVTPPVPAGVHTWCLEADVNGGQGELHAGGGSQAQFSVVELGSH